jgi:hypothetical protein
MLFASDELAAACPKVSAATLASRDLPNIGYKVKNETEVE